MSNFLCKNYLFRRKICGLNLCFERCLLLYKNLDFSLYLRGFRGVIQQYFFYLSAPPPCACEYVDNFNPNISKNPFAYFTQICWFAFIRRIMKEKKQSIVKGKLIMGMPYDEALMIDEDINKAVMEDTLRNTHTFVELAAEEDKKQKQKAEERKAAREAKRAKQKEQTSLEELFEWRLQSLEICISE